MDYQPHRHASHTQLAIAATACAVVASVLLVTDYFLQNAPNAEKRRNIGENEEGDQIIAGSSPPKAYVGLANLGNTCYLNSLLQALSGSIEYMRFAKNIIRNELIVLGEGGSETNCNDILYYFILVLLQLDELDQDVDPS